MTTFGALGLTPFLLRAVEALGYQTPTPIQQQAIPLVLTGRDVAAEAQTGSGKTAAFALPIVQRLCEGPTGLETDPPGVLVIVPTRELALQVAGVFKQLARSAPRPIKVLAVIGGEPIESQIEALYRGVRVVVATPGRLQDLLDRDEVALTGIHTLVLDEADKLLDLGFRAALDALLEETPTTRQTLLFTATLPDGVRSLGQRVLRDPTEVRIDDARVPVEGIAQRVYEVDRDRRRMLLQHLAKTEEWGQTLVFVATRRAAENLAAKLRRDHLSAEALHGKLGQADRTAVLKAFKGRHLSLLVATDIAARGIDFPKLDVVVNFDLPRSPRDYVHRIGRTGRAGETGTAVSFIDHQSAAHFGLIEKRTQQRLVRQQLPGFELTGEAETPRKGPAPVKGKRKSKKDKLREAARAAAQDAPPAD